MQKIDVTSEIVLLGSVPNILRGQPGRTTADLDIWNPSSHFDRSRLAQATHLAGLIFDPKGEMEPNRAYLQVVDPGVVQLGDFEPQKIATYGGLNVFSAPAENLIASKLCRADQQDLADIAWLIEQCRPHKRVIEKIIKAFRQPQRGTAAKNLVYLNDAIPLYRGPSLVPNEGAKASKAIKGAQKKNKKE